MRNFSKYAGIALILVLACMPLVVGGSFGQSRLLVAMAYLMAAIGLNLAMGYAGEFVLGHPVIMGVSAYAAGILSTVFGWPAAAAFPFGVLAGALAGLLIMSPGLRVRGWYYALITMFAVLVLPPLAILAAPWTGGEDGLSGIRPIALFGMQMPDWALLELTVLSLGAVWWGIDNFTRSGWGYRIRALRDARQAAEASGIDLTETRLVVYLLTSIPAAIAGVILAYSARFVGIDMFGINLMLMLLTGVVLGGPGTRWGPVVGMAPLLFLSFWVGPFSPFNAVGLGVGLLVGAIIFPDGIMTAINRRMNNSCPTSASDDPQPAQRVVVEHTETHRAAAGQAEAPGELIIRVRGVAKRFGGNQALAGVDFEMRRGALVGLVGPNGSGKSTLINALSGFLRPDTGSIEIAGSSIDGLPVYRVARTGIGRTFQVPQLIEEFTAIENIEIGLIASEPRALLGSLLSSAGVARGARRRRARALEVFELIGLPREVRDLPVESLSLGLKRVVEVGRAIVNRPKLILLDEPAAGLNDDERAQLGKLLQRLRGFGMSLLVVEHNVPFMLGICDELVLLEAGKVTCTARLDAPLPERLVAYLHYRTSAEAAAPGGNGAMPTSDLEFVL